METYAYHPVRWWFRRTFLSGWASGPKVEIDGVTCGTIRPRRWHPAYWWWWVTVTRYPDAIIDGEG